jgi:adenylate cyclase
MPSDPVERKLAAILSADAVGYSRLMAEDEVSTVQTLTAYRDVVGMLVHQHRGRVVDSPGDNLLAEFPSALNAVQAAVEIQRVIKARNTAVPADRQMEFRIGVHLGDVIVEGERIYGDGVNIAARLEGLADPGGVCISGTVHEQVQRKLDLTYEDLGKQALKNIPDPVQAYRVRLEPDVGIPTESLPGMDELTVPGFHGAPAVAVLPFDNLSGDPEQEYFADGIAEDLITQLSATGLFPVIARNSSFVYKGQAVDVKRVSRELGVRYLVEGSVRKAGDRVRISAQLIDATTGAHIWAGRYDRQLADIFTVQDEITVAIAGAMGPGLWQFEQEHARRRLTENLTAWDCVQRGFWHLFGARSGSVAEARTLFQRAVDLDPNFALAFVGLAFTHVTDLMMDWTRSHERALDDLVRAAEASVRLDGKLALGHCVLGYARLLTGQPQKAIAALERAVELDPSLAIAHAFLGDALCWAARADEAIASAEKAMRISPHDPMMWSFCVIVGQAHSIAGRYEEAIHWLERSLQLRPEWPPTHIVVVSSYAQLGRLREARGALERLLGVWPAVSLSTMRGIYGRFEARAVEPLLDGLRKAGLKE